MITNHFKMTDNPFAENPVIDAIFRDERMTQGLARLNYMVQNSNVALITGDPGVGKSVLIKLFMNSLGKNRYQPVHIRQTRLSSLSFLKFVVHSLGEVPARGKEKVLLQILDKIKSCDVITTLLIDQAHLLDPDVLIDFQLIISSAIEDNSGLKIVLVGYPLIAEELRRSRHESLRQLITVGYHIAPMTLSQTSQYIDFQLRRVKCSEKLFEDEVKKGIHEFGRGIPRVVNNLATACLLIASAENLRRINNEIFSRTLDEFTI